jgi:hypothetical protein
MPILQRERERERDRHPSDTQTHTHTQVIACIMPICALCDMTESVFIAAKCYDVVLKGMILGALFLFATLWLGPSIGLGLETMWVALGVLFSVRVLFSLFLFNSPSSPIPSSSAQQPAQVSKKGLN